MSSQEKKEVSRRDYLKTTGAAVAGLVVGGALGYLAKPTEITTQTVTATQTVTLTGTAPPPTTPIAQPFKGATIVATGIEGFPEIPAIQKLLPEFKTETGIDVTYTTQAYATVLEKNMVDLAAGKGVYDAVHVETIWWGQYIPFLYPLDEFMANPNLFDKGKYDLADIMPATLKAVTKDGKLYGFPYVCGIPLLWYRKDLLENAGLPPPKNVEEYYDTAKAITKKKADGTVDQYGTCVSGARTALLDEWISFWTDYLVMNHKSIPEKTICYEDWTPAFNSEEGRMALQLYYNLFKETSPPESINYEFGEAIGAMASGLVAMQWNWPNAAHLLDDPSFSKVVGKCGAEHTWPGRLGANTYSMAADSKRKEPAFLFMAWATNKETTKKTVAISANVPTRKSALLDPELQKIRWHFPALYESYETAIIYPPVPEWSEMDDAISINFAKVLTKEFTVKQALDKAEEDVTKVLKDAGYL